MKKNTKPLLGIILIGISVFVLTYCSKRTSSTPEALAQPQSVSKSLEVPTTYTVGTVTIQTNNSGDIVVLVNSQDQENDKLFILQETESKVVINRTFKKAEVLYMAHSVIVNSLDSKERYYLNVSKAAEKAVYAKLPDSYRSFFTSTVSGYGLAQIRGEIPKDIAAFNRSNDVYKDLRSFRHTIVTDDPVTGGQTCDNGGPGSTSCSVTGGSHSCSVSCKSGYYSCCTDHTMVPPECKCIKETAP